MLASPYQLASPKSSQYSHIGGELSSHKAQLREWENDMKDFKDVNKKYTDQLVKVKVIY